MIEREMLSTKESICWLQPKIVLFLFLVSRHSCVFRGDLVNVWCKYTVHTKRERVVAQMGRERILYLNIFLPCLKKLLFHQNKPPLCDVALAHLSSFILCHSNLLCFRYSIFLSAPALCYTYPFRTLSPCPKCSGEPLLLPPLTCTSHIFLRVC